MYIIEELTMGLTPEPYKFNTFEEAVAEIHSYAEEYKQRKDAYEIALKHKRILNVDKKSWRYSEHWVVYSEYWDLEEDEPEHLFINREHFADGTNAVSVDYEPLFWNYKSTKRRRVV